MQGPQDVPLQVCSSWDLPRGSFVFGKSSRRFRLRRFRTPGDDQTLRAPNQGTLYIEMLQLVLPRETACDPLANGSGSVFSQPR